MAEVKATATFRCYEQDEAGNHVERVVEQGESFPAGHEIVVAHGEFFEPPKPRSRFRSGRETGGATG
jgi:hypothetical protein